jgi:hypothetical protein
MNHAVYQILIILLSLFMLSVQEASAVTPIWSKQYDAYEGMMIQSMQKVADGFVAMGEVCPPPDAYGCNRHLMVVKFDAEGQVAWSKYYSGFTGVSSWYEKGSMIQPVADGYVLLGQVYNDMQTDVQLIKLDLQGEVVWSRVYKGASHSFANDLQAVDGGYLVVGSRGDSRNNEQDAWVVKLGLDGNILWEKTLGTTTGNERAQLIQSFAGGYVIAGYIWPEEGTPDNSIWLMKLNPANGSVLWQKTYASPAGQYLGLRSMHAGPQGLVLAGKITDQDYKAFAMSLNSAGEIQWQRYYHDADYIFPTFASIRQLDNGYIVAGRQEFYGSDGDILPMAWVLRLDDGGTIVWERTHAIGRNAMTYALEPHEDGYVLGGTTYAASEWSHQQGFLFRLNGDGIMPGCSLLERSPQAVVEPGNFEQDADGIEHQIDLKPAIQVATMTMSATPFAMQEIVNCPPSYGPLGSAQRHCEAVLNRRVCELLRFGEYSLSVGEQYLACPPACGFSIDERSPQVPGAAVEMYVQMREILGMTQQKEVSPKYFDDLAGVLKKSTSRPPGTIDKTVASSKGAKKLPPKLFEQLAKSANEMALNLAVPKLSPVKVGTGQYSAVDFNGVAWLGFRGLSKAGRASLQMIPGLPAKTEKYKAGWPVAHYQFEFSGSLAKDGFVDVHLYIGRVNHAGPLSDLRILEWDGKNYRDITTNVDQQRGIISGRTKKLGKLVVLSLLRSQQSAQGHK